MKKNRIYKVLASLLILALIGFSSCEKQEVIKVIGFVQGYVYDGNTNVILDNVKVEWEVAGNKDTTTSTATDGYKIDNLFSGNYNVTFSKANYTTVVYEISIPKDDFTVTAKGGGNKEYVVTADPNLYPLNASLKGRLYKTENGKNIPIAGATVQIDYNGTYKESDQYYRFIPALYSATTDADGYYSFVNLPATAANLRYLDYTDSNGETYINANSQTGDDYYTRINLQSGNTYTLANVYLTMVTDPIILINSNAYASAGVGTTHFDVASDITLTFNKAVDQATTLEKGYVRLSVGGADVAVSVTYNGNLITLNPETNLSPNTSYTVSYSVYTPLIYSPSTSTVTFSTVNDAVIPAAVSNFAINYDFMGIGWFADYSTFQINFVFDMVNNATSYQIYAKDSYSNSEYILIGSPAGQSQPNYLPAGTKVTTNTSLPSQFDYYANDGFLTPFSHGTIVTYKVRAVNSVGAGPFSNEISVKDQTAFNGADMSLSNQSSTSNNTAGVTPKTFTVDLTINNGQYADMTTIPTFGIYTAGDVLVAGATFSFVWTDHQLGVVTVTVPAGADYAPNFLRVYGVKDSSGNIQIITDYDSLNLN